MKSSHKVFVAMRHFLLKCGDFAHARNNCFHVDNTKQLFQNIHIDRIMAFLKEKKINKFYRSFYTPCFVSYLYEPVMTYISYHCIIMIVHRYILFSQRTCTVVWNSSLILSDIIHALSCQQSYFNSMLF